MAFDSGSGESITRYITNSRDIRRSNNTVRHTAFKPSKSGRHSVYWISGLQETTIWDIGNTHVAPSRGPILARADLNSLAVYAEGLSVEVTGIPHIHHADIVGWELNSTKPRLQAMKLAESAILRHVPS